MMRILCLAGLVAAVAAQNVPVPTIGDYGAVTEAKITANGTSQSVEIDYANQGKISGYRVAPKLGDYVQYGIANGDSGNVFTYTPGPDASNPSNGATNCMETCSAHNPCNGGDCNQSYNIFSALPYSTHTGSCSTSGSDEFSFSAKDSGVLTKITYCFHGSVPISVDVLTTPSSPSVHINGVRHLMTAADQQNVFLDVLQFGAAPPAATFTMPSSCSCSSA